MNMNQDYRNVSFQVVEELFESVDKLLRQRKQNRQAAEASGEARVQARNENPQQTPARLNPRLGHSPR